MSNGCAQASTFVHKSFLWRRGARKRVSFNFELVSEAEQRVSGAAERVVQHGLFSSLGLSILHRRQLPAAWESGSTWDFLLTWAINSTQKVATKS